MRVSPPPGICSPVAICHSPQTSYPARASSSQKDIRSGADPLPSSVRLGDRWLSVGSLWGSSPVGRSEVGPVPSAGKSGPVRPRVQSRPASRRIQEGSQPFFWAFRPSIVCGLILIPRPFIWSLSLSVFESWFICFGQRFRAWGWSESSAHTTQQSWSRFQISIIQIYSWTYFISASAPNFYIPQFTLTIQCLLSSLIPFNLISEPMYYLDVRDSSQSGMPHPNLPFGRTQSPFTAGSGCGCLHSSAGPLPPDPPISAATWLPSPHLGWSAACRRVAAVRP